MMKLFSIITLYIVLLTSYISVFGLVSSDQRPRYHVMPWKWWTNDIDGPFYFNNTYHVMFAYHENSTRFSKPNQWYHLASKDLAYWRTLPPALLPGPEWYDTAGVMTGSTTILDDSGKSIPIILYSSQGSDPDTHIHAQRISLAHPKDLSDPNLVEWTKDTKNPLLINNQSVNGTLGQFRDPSTAWKSDGRWWMIVAAQINGTGQPALHSSHDFETWHYEGPLWGDAPEYYHGNMIECPDFFALPNTSDLYVLKWSGGGSEPIVVGRFSNTTHRFIPLPQYVKSAQSIGLGMVYASKSFYDPMHNQQVWWGWLKESWVINRACVNASVCNTHTLPRSIKWDPTIGAGGRVVTPPIKQLESLRNKQPVTVSHTKMEKDTFINVAAAHGMQLELIATFQIPNQIVKGQTCGISTRASEDTTQRTDGLVTFTDITHATVSIRSQNQAGVLPENKHWTYPLLLKQSETTVKLQLFIDHSAVELYAMDGRTAIAARTYPYDNSSRVGFFSEGGPCVLIDLKIWEISSIWI